jgi:hypothetical protein
MLSDTFAGIAPGSVPAFLLAQLLGGLLAVATVTFLNPKLDLPLTRLLSHEKPPDEHVRY